MLDRDFMLNRLKSKVMTPGEFNYEVISAPPLMSMFTPDDIRQLNNIATDIIYSTKLKEKYDAIDKIMTNRGFEKMVSGTNRVTYRPLFANNFVVKVAYDSVALQDSIREFYNQNLIKPFCTKVFEVSPCGTLGVFEKVNPVTSRKEYISMAADIYQLLSEFIIGEYIIDDIGTNYFNNIGFRMGFGAVVLDFPYVYKVDGKKLWCNKLDHNNPTGYCNGEIDYDNGFNKLRCKKCGAEYKPYELAKKIEYKNKSDIIVESEERRMKIRLSGGNHKFVKEEIITGDFQSPKKVIKSNKINKIVEKELEKRKQQEEKKEEPVSKEEPETVEEENVKTVNGTEPAKEEKVVKSAIEIDDNIKGKDEDPGYGYEKELAKMLSDINHMYYYSDKSDDEKNTIVKTICDMLESIFAEKMDIAIDLLTRLLRKNTAENIKLLIDNNNNAVNDQIIRSLFESNNYKIHNDVTNVNDDNNDISFDIESSIVDVDTTETISYLDGFITTVSKDIISNIISNESEDDTDEEDSGEADGFDFANAETVAKKDLFPQESKGRVIVIKNDNGTYLTINGKIIAIDHIDNRNINDIAIVPQEWYNDARDAMDHMNKDVSDETEEDSVDEENEEE